MTTSDTQPDILIETPLETGPRISGIATFFRLPLAASPKGLDIAVCGVPFDLGITSRTGTRHAAREVRAISFTHIEPYHPVTNQSPFERVRAADIGDVPIIPTEKDVDLKLIENFFADIYAAGARPLAVGGDHLITLPILRGVARERPVGMVQIDAHSDTDDGVYHDGTHFKYDNATVFRRAVEEGLLDPKRVTQIGIRGPRASSDDLAFALDSGIRVITMDEFDELGIEGTLAEARRVAGREPTYLSFDVDGLDAVFCPGTGCPEIGGLTTREAQKLVRGLKGLDFIGADFVEVSPPLDTSGQTCRVAAHFMFEMFDVLAEAASAKP